MTLGAGVTPAAPDPPGVRVILDARPLQEAATAPLTAAYLDSLLAAFDEEPIDGESFAFLLRSDADDPTRRFDRLEVVGRRLLPPTRLLRSGSLTVDPFLLRGASIGAAWRADRDGAAGAVYHAAGGAVPLASRAPLVATLLDLAPWELPNAYQRTGPTRFGQRLRARILRDAAAVIVGSDAVALSARRLVRIRSDRIRVVPLAPRSAFAAAGRVGAAGRVAAAGDTQLGLRAERERLGLPERYLVYSGRYDARHDVATLLDALGDLAGAGRPTGLPADVSWPPRVLLVDATPADRASLARVAGRAGVGESLAYAPHLEPDRLATLVAGARAVLLPVVSESAGLAAIEAIAAGTPVIAGSVGALPGIVGAAGILVEPRDAGRLAIAIATAWSDDALHGRLVAATRERSMTPRTWADVARETREVYAEASGATGRAREPRYLPAERW